MKEHEWISVKDKLPKEFTHVFCYCPGIDGQLAGRYWMDTDFCIGEHVNGIWKKADNENIKVSHWLPIPEVSQ